MSDDLIERLRECEYLCSSLRGHLDDAGYLEGGPAHSKLAIIDAAVTEAAAALEAAREDAERYRWLRDRHDKTHQDWHVRDQWNNVPAIGGLDAAIDAAREAHNG